MHVVLDHTVRVLVVAWIAVFFADVCADDFAETNSIQKSSATILTGRWSLRDMTVQAERLTKRTISWRALPKNVMLKCRKNELMGFDF
jgi:uncharacterized membrane protein AbrB (regulator of aidB expression)